MSWWVSVVDAEGETLHLPEKKVIIGGTYRPAGQTEAEINITYNYSKCFNLVWGHSLDELNGKPIVEVIPKLKEAVDKLGTNHHDDYWAPTPGNAGKALADLLALCEAFAPFKNVKLKVS